MILSKQKYCLLFTGVEIESQNRTVVFQTKRTCATLCEAFTFVLEKYMCNFKAWYTNKKLELRSWAQTVLHLKPTYFFMSWEGFYVSLSEI